MFPKILLLAAAIIILISGTFFYVMQRQTVTSRIEDPKPAPDFSLKDYADREVKLSDFKGKNLVINSWASWCPFCKDELLDFAAVQKEFGEKFVTIVINRAESPEVAKKYSDDLGITGKLIFLMDPSDSFYQTIGGFSMPETIFVDKEGFIRGHRRGPMKAEETRRRVQQLLGCCLPNSVSHGAILRYL